MASLNIYRKFFDTSTKEGISLYNNAINNFKSPLADNEKITLHPKDSQVFSDIVKSLSNQYGYDFLIQNLPTTRTVINGANVGDPQTITYGNHINLLEEYAPNNVERAKIFASVVWGNGSFTLQNPQQISELTEAAGDWTAHNPPRLTNQGKDKMRD